MRYLGIDFGSKRVGLALSDEAGTMGFPYAVVPSNGRLIDEIRDVIARKEVGVVVIGKSMNLDGKDNPIADKAKIFARELERSTEVEVEWEMEAYTTQEARRGPEGERRTRRESPDAVDASAAALILTSFLSRKSNS